MRPDKPAGAGEGEGEKDGGGSEGREGDGNRKGNGGVVSDVQEGDIVEIEGEGEDLQEVLEKLKLEDKRKEDIQRIKAKALMRRAKARSESGGWANLQGAEEGMYLSLLFIPFLPSISHLPSFLSTDLLYPTTRLPIITLG